MQRTLVLLSMVLILTLAGPSPCWNWCGHKGGRCNACGGTYGWCCMIGSTKDNCNGFNGCRGYHCCRLGNCWAPCGHKAGPCDKCGKYQACCRKGDHRGGDSCNNGRGGCTGYWCCDKDYCLDGRGIDNRFEVYSIKYHVDKSNLIKEPPTRAGEQIVNNLKGSIDQSSTFDASETYTETKSFSHTAGASVTVETEFSVGIPLIASGSVSVEVSASYEFSYGKDVSKEKSITASYGCNAPPKKYVKCTVTYTKFRATVPYTAIMRRKDRHGCKYETKGVFREVSAFQMHNEIEERDHAFRLVKRTIVPLDYKIVDVE